MPMKEATLDQNAISQLGTAEDYLKLRDAQGHAIGFFVPMESPTAQLLSGARSKISPEEAERRMREEATRPLSEFWAEMRQKHPEKFSCDTP